MQTLNSKELKLIEKVIISEQPALLKQLDTNNIPDNERKQIEQIILNEFLTKGLLSTDEPNAYGLQLDAILGKLGYED